MNIDVNKQVKEITYNGTPLIFVSDNNNTSTEEAVLIAKTFTANGVYNASNDDADGYRSVTVDVPDPVLDKLSITTNGTYAPPSGTDGYNSIVVNVPSEEPTLDDLSVTANGTYTPPSNIDGYNKVVVNVPSNGITPTGTLNITTNGTHNVYNYASAKVNVPTSDPVLKSINITENGRYTPSTGTDGYNEVYVSVSADGTELAPIHITENGTYEASDNGVDGYSVVTVNVPIPEEPVLISKGITANGVYLASNDKADGYSMVVVDLDASGNTITFTENGTYNAKDFYSNKLGFGEVKVMVPTASEFVRPIIGFIATEFNTDGLPLKGFWYGNKVGPRAFYECRTLTDLLFEDVVTEIKENAFYYTTGLTSLTELPDTITTIGNSAFYGCKAPLTKLPDSLTTLEENAFRQSDVAIQEIPAGVTEIPNYCFYWCSGITNMTLHANINSIGSNGFGKNENLDTVTFKGTPTSINSAAFSNCTGIRLINVPWASGAVANAPWGATNATINYNYTG